jgi:hypothetical protein
VVVHTVRVNGSPGLIEVVVHSAEALRAVVRGAGNKVGRITTAGRFNEFAIPTANSAPFAVAAGPMARYGSLETRWRGGLATMRARR